MSYIIISTQLNSFEENDEREYSESQEEENKNGFKKKYSKYKSIRSTRLTIYISSKFKSDPMKLVGKTFPSLISLKLYINDLNINLIKMNIYCII